MSQLVSAEILSDNTTPILLLKKLSQISSNFYLFESVESEESIGRYSFLGYNPILNVKYKSGVTTTTSGQIVTTSTDDPIEILRSYTKNYQTPKSDNLPPFTGGFVGYMSYEMINYAEPKLTLPTNNFNDFEFNLFNKVIAFDNLKKKIIIIISGYNKEESTSEINNIINLIQENTTTCTQPIPQNLTFVQNKTEAQYEQMVHRAKNYITSGDIFQVVLSRKFEATFNGSLIDAYRTLRVTNPSPYMYFIKSDNLEICGASPETLVKVIDNKITTFPVAGTRPRGKTDEQDKQHEQSLLADEKELAEHNMLVDLARNDVGRVAKLDSVNVDKYLEIHRYSRVMHISSTVTGTLRDGLDAFDAIGSILPAGTLSGAPKFRACEIIAELEGESRGIYGGAIGYIDLSGNMDMCIAIRTAISDGKTVCVQAGAGIVHDSIAKNEYDECAHKASAVMSALNNNL